MLVLSATYFLTRKIEANDLQVTCKAPARSAAKFAVFVRWMSVRFI